MQLHITNSTIHLSVPASIAVPGEALQFTELSAAFTSAGPTPPAPGTHWPSQGGHYICTLPALQGLPERHLIAGEHEVDDLTYGPAVEVAGAASQIDGAANTAALLAHSDDHPAARWASTYTADGHADFHLPSRLDLLMAYICAPQLFQKSGWYWSSTQGSRHIAFGQCFEDGNSDWDVKGSEHRVRAFRWIRLNPLNA